MLRLVALLAILLVFSSCAGADHPEEYSAPEGYAASEEYVAPEGYAASEEYIASEDSSLCTSLPVTDYLRASEQEEEAGPGEVALNPHHKLSVPTYITRIGSDYFIVDCYNDQVIYNDNLTDPLCEWKVMTNEISRGHTIASDGIVYLVDDTENNGVLIFEKKDGIFCHTQTFHEIGNRPHYIVYDPSTATFYVWSSMSGEMYLMRHSPGDTRMYLTEICTMDMLTETYVRSFSIIGDEIYFVSGMPGEIGIVCADRDTFEVRNIYPVPASMAGMVQITKIEDYFYITVSTDAVGDQKYATILRTKSLSKLIENGYEDIYENFIGGGTPYYITCFDDAYYLVEHRLVNHSVWRFRVEDNEMVSVETVY